MKKISLYLLLGLTAQVFAINQPCQETGQVCVDNSPSKVFNGQTFTKEQLGIDCWKYDKTYNCPTVDSCQSYVNNGCIIDVAKNSCTETNASGTCVSWSKSGSCDNGKAETNTMISCGNEICKPGANGAMANCYQADPTSDNDFGEAMAALELANEMGSMKNCYDKNTGAKCRLSDPEDPSKGVDPNCECFFFQGKFTTYKHAFNVWDPTGSSCKIGKTFTNCDRVADDFAKNSSGRKNLSQQKSPMLMADPLPTRDVDAWSDKGQLNLSLTGSKDTTGIRAGNPYVYSFASSSQSFDQTGQNVSGKTDDWAAQNQKNSNLALSANSSEMVINKDDPNSSSNQVHWNNGGSQTSQGSKATNSGTMKIIQDAAKMVGDVMDFGSAFSQSCTAEDQSKMINVGKHNCLFDYSGVPGPENNEWILYTYGDKKRFSYQNCTYQTTFWGAGTACVSGAQNYTMCKTAYGLACEACLIGICPSYCDDLDKFCYGLTLGGRGGQDCGGLTGGNDVIFTGKVNCCFSSTISKLITKAAFDQGVGGRPKLSQVQNYVAQYEGTEMCSVAELANGTCNQGNTGLATANTFQAMCERGIALNEMTKIDFSQIDFSEFYAEANKGVNTSTFNNNTQSGQNQGNRVQNNVNGQKQKTVQFEGKNYFDY